MGISAFDKLLNIEKVTLAPSLKIKTGDKKSLQVIIAGDVYVGRVDKRNPDLIAEKATELITEGRKESKDSKLRLAFGPFMGIVKSPELPGTRLHFEFAVINGHSVPKVIAGTYARLNDVVVHFKKFFKVALDGSRSPDLSTRFPIIIGANGSARLSIEFENLEKPSIIKGDLKGDVFVLTGDDTIASREFTFEVNEAMVNTLRYLQGVAEKGKAPVVFDAMVKS